MGEVITTNETASDRRLVERGEAKRCDYEAASK